MSTRNLGTGKYVAFADIRKQAEGKPDALAVEREVQQMERRPCFACGARRPRALAGEPEGRVPAGKDERVPTGARPSGVRAGEEGPLEISSEGSLKTGPSGMVVLENGEAFVVHSECLEKLKAS